MLLKPSSLCQLNLLKISCMWRHPEEKKEKKKPMAFSFLSYLKDLLLYSPCTTMDELLMKVSVQMAAATSY